MKVESHLKIPKGKQWSLFLKENRPALFAYLSKELVNVPLSSAKPNVKLFSTSGENVLCTHDTDLSLLMPCSHEEADTRAALHLKYAVMNGHTKAYLRTVDTDWFVNYSFIYPQLELDELWIGFGTGKHYRDIPIHHTCAQLGEPRCKALPLIHGLTGSDSSSFLYNIGKLKGWQSWELMGDELTQTLIDIQADPSQFDMDSDSMKVLERFIILQYDPKSPCQSLNEARKVMFLKHLKPIEAIPPTKHAAFQYFKRAILGADAINKSFIKQPVFLSPGDYGWQWNERLNIWMPYWSDLPDVSKGCAALISCGCKVACKGNCKCHREGQRCTSLCKCEGMCINNEGYDD